MKRIVIALLLSSAAQCQIAQVAPSTNQLDAEFVARALTAMKLDPGEMNALVMDSTFQIISNRIDQTQIVITGTGFILARAITTKHHNLQHVLFTAAHVLSDCAKNGDSAKIRFRHTNPEDPLHWRLEDWPIKITNAGRPLWVKHPAADVAVLAVDVPDGAIKTVLPIEILAARQKLNQLYVGRTVYALGYPFGALGLSGFPILRPAQITSRAVYDKEPFALSFQIYPGDSGGPVYSIEQTEKSFNVFILGLMYQAVAMKGVTVPTAIGPETFFVGLGYVIPSTQLLETVNLLPSKAHATATSNE